MYTYIYIYIYMYIYIYTYTHTYAYILHRYRHIDITDIGKGQMGSALTGSLQSSCFLLTEGLVWYSH